MSKDDIFETYWCKKPDEVDIRISPSWTPGWREDITQPCAQGKTYGEAVNTAKETLEMLVKATNDEEENII